MAGNEVETFEDRLKRWTLGADREWALTLFMMLRNTVENEVTAAAKEHNLVLTMVGIHAVMQILTEKVFGLPKGSGTTKFYFEHFVDGKTPDRQYSTVAAQLHRARNVMAHEGFAKSQY